jgi:peptidoglycan/xylan/chitin deacetylase (PgdA/CDA1 family)
LKPGSAILLYHSIDASGDAFSTPPAVFRAQMEGLAESGLRCVRLQDAAAGPGAAALTFDDGYEDFLEQALPLLLEYGLPATLFVVSGQCGGPRRWVGRGGAGKRLLGWPQLRELVQAGIELGAHTVDHSDLTAVAPEEAVRQMADCRKEIEDRTGRPVTAFAYPYGRWNAAVKALARKEFQLACGMRTALADRGADRFELPRICEFYVRRRLWLRLLGRPEGRAWLAMRRWISAGRDWLNPGRAVCT